jgi:hypothetical protein
MNAELEGDGQVIPDAIRDLLEQRARYHDWLQKLEDVGGKYRPEVADRVRTDYRARLSSVEKELHGHRSVLEGSLEEHGGRLDELSRRHEEHAARLEEAELRFQVGEFEQSEWDERRGEGERELARVTEELEAERAAVRELEGVLAEVGGEAERAATMQVEPGAWSGAAAAAVAGGAPEIEFRDEEPELEEQAEPTDEAADGDVDVRGERPVEPRGGAGEATFPEVDEAMPAAGAAAEVEEAPPAEDDFLDELEFLESLSLDDPESFDAVSRMLEEEGGEPDGDGSGRGGAG